MNGLETLPLLALVGPTASGKTAVGIELAKQIGAEIISADAVAVYRGLNIGAAKPTEDEQASVPVHLIDVADPNEDFSVADFARLAENAMEGIRKRGKIPLLVGGTGLYIRSVTATLSLPNVPAQEAFRAERWAEVEQHGAPFLHERLEQIDPISALKISAGDAKRIIRALEVYEVTGKPLSSFHTPEGVHGIPRENTFVFGLTRERKALYNRIDLRVDAMLHAGFVDEVRGLLANGYGPECKAMQSLGYRQLIEYLRGEKGFEVAVAEIKQETRRYAKRQIAWFRGDPQVHWVDTDGFTSGNADSNAPPDVIQLLAQNIRAKAQAFAATTINTAPDERTNSNE